MQGLQFDRTYFANMRIEQVDIRRGLGHGLLGATIRVHNSAPAAPNLPDVIHVSGEVRDRDGTHIAELRPTTLRWYANRADDTIRLVARVSFRALSTLHEARRSANEDVQITFALTTDLDGKHGWEQYPIELQQRIPGSDWLALLERARHTTYAVIELPLDGAPVPAGLVAATTRYRAALDHLRHCQWDDAIAECRQVFDDLAVAIGATETTPPWADYANQQRTTWSFAERCSAIRAIVRHATHTAHHGQATFTADEARYIVDLTGVALKHYGARLRS